MNTATKARPHRESEGTATARAILRDTRRAEMPRPYLLDTGSFPIRKTREPREAAPLRLIKPAHRASRSEPSVCGFGLCNLDPECTRRCRYQEADEALRGHHSDRHSHKQALPPLRTAQERQQGHNLRRAVIAGLAVFWLVAISVAAYSAWGA